MTIQEISKKYSNIEDKILFPSYEEAAIELARDIAFEWNITDPELYRVISLLSSYTKINLIKHLDSRFSYMGLYPTIIKSFNIKPETKNN